MVHILATMASCLQVFHPIDPGDRPWLPAKEAPTEILQLRINAPEHEIDPDGISNRPTTKLIMSLGSARG